MTESPISQDQQPPEPAPEPPPTPPSRPRRDAVPWLYGLGFLILAGALAWLWHHPGQPAGAGVANQDIQAALQAIRTLESRVTRLEQRPAPTAGGTDVGPLIARLDALEKRTPTSDGQIGARLDALAGRIDSLAGREEGGVSELGHRLEADEAKISAMAGAASQVTALADRAGRLGRIQAAMAALSAGQPLGELPNARAALTRFATTKPPTEAGLRLAFPQVEQAALAASRPATDDKPLLNRILARAEGLVTVRQGDRVLVGDAAAGVLARARTTLDAGDLAGAVAAVSTLQGPAAQAVSGWLSDARALLDARAALADMAEHV